MGLLEDKYTKTGGHQYEDAASKFSSEGRTKDLDLTKVIIPGRDTDPLYESDLHIVLKYFEVEVSQWGEEDYAWAPHYRDVYSTESFSKRVREQMDYYPGMHSGVSGQSRISSEDPFKTNAKAKAEETTNYWNSSLSSPETFMEGLKQREPGINYGELAKDPSVRNIAEAIAGCTSCFDRIFDGAQLLPDGDLLEIHGLNIKLRTNLISDLKKMFNDPGFNVNICDLLKLLSGLCPSDLLALLMLFSQYLAKLNLDFAFNLDLVLELIGPILSPFLDALSQWLDKWIQLIVAPIICIIDHINATLYIAQNFKIPASEASVNLDYAVGVAAPNVLNHLSNYSSEAGFRGSTATGEYENDPSYVYMEGFHDEQIFGSPDNRLYNPVPPEVPIEEFDFAVAQIADDWGVSPNSDYWVTTDYYNALSTEERRATWDELKQKRWEYEHEMPAPLRQPKADGSRWSKDQIPQSEKRKIGDDFSFGEHPPEKQTRAQQGDAYYIDGGVIVDPILQVRNIAQGAIGYIQDWFKWVTQMIYDLLGTDFGWMKKKMSQTQLKSRLIQLIMMIKAILQAIQKNGLECGVSNNFDAAQLEWILAEQLNTNEGGYKFAHRPDGSFELISPPGVGESSSRREAEVKDSSSGADSEASSAQKIVESGIIVKDCLKTVSKEDVDKVRQWISDFTRRSDAG
jgi:hypothetical protein